MLLHKLNATVRLELSFSLNIPHIGTKFKYPRCYTKVLICLNSLLAAKVSGLIFEDCLAAGDSL